MPRALVRRAMPAGRPAHRPAPPPPVWLPPGRRMVGQRHMDRLAAALASIVTAPAIFERSRPANLRITPATAPPGTACRICLIWRPTSSGVELDGLRRPPPADSDAICSMACPTAVRRCPCSLKSAIAASLSPAARSADALVLPAAACRCPSISPRPFPARCRQAAVLSGQGTASAARNRDSAGSAPCRSRARAGSWRSRRPCACRRHRSGQRRLDLVRIVRLRQRQAVGDAQHVSIDGDGLLAERRCRGPCWPSCARRPAASTSSSTVRGTSPPNPPRACGRRRMTVFALLR